MNLENSFQKRYSIITNLKLEQFLWIKSKKLDVEVNPYFASVLIIYTQRYNTTKRWASFSLWTEAKTYVYQCEYSEKGF